MKILHVNKLYSPWIGGVEKVVQNIAEGLDGFENEVLVCQPKGKRVVDGVNGVAVYRAASFGILWGMPLSLDFFRLFRERVRDADLVFLHHPFPLGFCAYLLFGKNKPLAVWYHSDIVRQKITGFLFKPFLNSVLKRAKIIFASSDKLAAGYNAKVIPFGIDIEAFAKNAAVEREAEKIRERFGAPVVLSVGRLVYYKGFEYLIRAIKNAEARLLIVGSGPLKGELLELADALGIKERVRITPPVHGRGGLAPYYYACDIFVLPSVERSEAFGIVQVEAMACGKPVINTDLPTGVPEVSVGGETGLTVPPKDAAALAKAVNTLLTDAALRKKMGAAARLRAEKVFSKKRFIEAIKKEIEPLIKL